MSLHTTVVFILLQQEELEDQTHADKVDQELQREEMV